MFCFLHSSLSQQNGKWLYLILTLNGNEMLFSLLISSAFSFHFSSFFYYIFLWLQSIHTVYSHELLYSLMPHILRVCVCVCCIYILYLLNNVINLIQLIGPDFNNIYSLRQFFASFCVVFCSVSRFLLQFIYRFIIHMLLLYIFCCGISIYKITFSWSNLSGKNLLFTCTFSVFNLHHKELMCMCVSVWVFFSSFFSKSIWTIFVLCLCV